MTEDGGLLTPVVSMAPGAMILIGGAEDKKGDRAILREVAKRVGDGCIVIATLASEEPERQWERYSTVFCDLGVGRLEHLSIQEREHANCESLRRMVSGAQGIFFTGGDQVRIATKLGGTPLFSLIRSMHQSGKLILAGTSAGASAMGETMLVSHGTRQQAHRVESAFFMARGLGLVRDLVIDQHFAQRARIERLVSAIAENPGVLGIGIDEDTAIVLENGTFGVVGSGVVYVADGRGVTYTNVTEKNSERTLCLFDVKLHVLSHGAAFDMEARRPGLA
jgi:cyanophycinase